MSKQVRNYVVRLSAEGARQMEADFKALGVSGERSLKRIESSGKPASAGLRATDRAARDLKSGLKSVGDELPALQRLTRFLGTTALAGGLVAFGKASIDVGREFQAAMKRVEAATSAGVTDMERLANKARATGASTAFTATQAAGAIEVIAKNGLDVGKILGGALDATVVLSAALGGDLAQSADLVTDVMKQFDLAASDLPRIADMVAGAALNSKFGFDDLRLAIGQAGGVAGKFGVDVQDFLTALAATDSAFTSGSDAGTSFKNFLQRLVPQSKAAKSAMAELGLEFFDSAGNMKSMGEIAGELQDGIAGLSQEARNGALQEIFGTDAIRTALSLAGVGAEGFAKLGESLREVSAAEQAQVRLEGLDGALKELASAWEAVQLASAENGGLDTAEAAVDRLTGALRYLTENFSEVEEVVERVSQALVVFLVGRGMTLAIAKAIAMRAAYIELAGQVSGLGTAASRSIGPLTRLGVAGRVLTGALGGPLALAITAGSLLALGIDTDRAADAIENADAASRRAAEALAAYQEAARRAKDEQAGLGGEVSATTAKMLEQSRVGLNSALAQAQEALAAARGAMSERPLLGLFGESERDEVARTLRRPNDVARYQNAQIAKGIIPEGSAPRPLNGYLEQLAELVEALADGRIEIDKFAAEWDQIASVPPRIDDLARALMGVIDAGLMGTQRFSEQAAVLEAAAKRAGLFGRELEAVNAASSEGDRVAAWVALLNAMRQAADASRQVHEVLSDDQRKMIETYVEANARVDELNAAVDETLELRSDDGTETVFQRDAEDAKRAAAEIEKVTAAYREYGRSRLAQAVPESSKGLLSNLEKETSGVDAAAALLKQFEGFIATPKWDVNAFRVGYGSDTVTLADGSIRKVTEGIRISVVDADRDLKRRIVEVQAALAKQIGSDRFAAMTPAQQGALSSVVYNYGAGELKPGGDLAGVLAAARNGSDSDIGAAIAELRLHNQGINSGRRLTEAAVFRDGIGSEGAGKVEAERLEAVEDARKKEADEAKKRLDTRKQDEEALRRMIEAGDDRVAQLELETSLMGKSVAEQARLTYLHEKLTEAKRAGIDVDTQTTASGEKLIDVIRRQADALAVSTAAQEASRLASEAATKATDAEIERVKESTDAIRNAFDNFKEGGGGLKGFFSDIFGFIADKLWDLAFNPLWDTLGKGLSSLLGGDGGGGLFSGIFGRADGGAIPALANGGAPQFSGRAAGAIAGSGGRRQDNILLWGSRGEFMHPAAAVDYYGMDFMEAVRQRRLPRLADGGALARPSLPARPGGQGAFARSDRQPGVIEVNVSGAKGNREVEDMVQRGVEAGLEIFNRDVLPVRFSQIEGDPRRRG